MRRRMACSLIASLGLAVLPAVLVGFAPPPDSGAGGEDPAARATQNALSTALDTALDDERHAAAFYRAVIDRHGSRAPFSNILRAEQRHQEALLAQYARLGLTPPEDRWAGHAFEVPERFAEACDWAVVSEVRNARLYDGLIASADDDQVRAVFERLRAASIERHLPAFERHGSGWQARTSEELSERQRAQRSRAADAQAELFARLFAELSTAVTRDGADGAIAVCADRAPVIAAEVGREKKLRIGRTSWALRNPKNTPPVWAQLAVDDRRDEPVSFSDRNGRLGTLSPIRLASLCVQCHGGADDLGPGVADAIAERYPEDHATGFAEGDLRGWFWVEVEALDP